MNPRHQGWLLLVAGLCPVAFLFGCGDGGGGAAAQAGETTPTEADATLATRPVHVPPLSDAQMRNIKIEEVRRAPVLDYLSAQGKVQFNEDQTALILAPVSGQVLSLKAKVGDMVKQGDTLFLINSREVASTIEDYLANRNDLELARKTYDMTKKLAADHAASTIALQQAENDLAKAKAHVARGEQQLRFLDVDGDGTLNSGELNPRIPIKAPRNGTVVERHLTEGQFVQADSTALLTIADLSSVWVLADIFERDLHLVKTGQKAEVTTLAYPDQKFGASVVQISSVVDPVTRTVKVRFLVSNPDLRLKPEMFAAVRLFLHESEQALAVPATAVFTEGGQHFAFVFSGGQGFDSREVQVAPLADRRLRVLGGLAPGEKVVTDGAMLLRSHSSQSGGED